MAQKVGAHSEVTEVYTGHTCSQGGDSEPDTSSPSPDPNTRQLVTSDQ